MATASYPPRVVSTIALLLASLGSPAWGIALGDLRVKSNLGEPLSAQINIDLGSPVFPAEACFRVVPDGGDLPSLGTPRLSWYPSPTNTQRGVLTIRSSQAISEPLIAFRLEINCEGIQYQRQFSLMLDPAPIAIRPPVSNDTPTPVLTAPPARPVVRTPPARAPRAIELWRPRTLEQIAAQRYRRHGAAYQRYLARLQDLNPDVTSVTQRLPIGTMVYLPPRVRASAPAARSTPASTAATSTAPASSNETPRLVLSEPGTSNPGTSPSDEQTYVQKLEQDLRTTRELQSKLQEEIHTLQQQLQTMQPSAPQAAIRVDGNPASNAPHRALAPDDSHLWWWLGGGLLLACVGFVAWRRHLQQRELYTAGSDITRFAGQATRAVGAGGTATGVGSMFRNTLIIGGVEVSEQEIPAAERGPILLAQGAVDEAISAMYLSIDEAPEDIERWLMLFRLLRQQGMKSDYQKLARRFRSQPHQPDDWELIRHIGARMDPENELYQLSELDDNSHQQRREELQRISAGMPKADADFAAAMVAPDLASKTEASTNEAEVKDDAPLMDFFGDGDKREQESSHEHITPPPTIRLDLPPLEPPRKQVETSLDEVISPDERK